MQKESEIYSNFGKYQNKRNNGSIELDQIVLKKSLKL